MLSCHHQHCTSVHDPHHRFARGPSEALALWSPTAGLTADEAADMKAAAWFGLWKEGQPCFEPPCLTTEQRDQLKREIFVVPSSEVCELF